MDDLERSIEERRGRVKRLEKEVAQASELLAKAQEELSVLLAARQIITKEQFAERDLISLPLPGTSETYHLDKVNALNGALDRLEEETGFRRLILAESIKTLKEMRHPREMTLVDQVIAILSEASQPIGPAEIRLELAKTGKDVPQNVMTGILSRLAKEKRVIRLERGKYRAAKKEDSLIEQKETA